MKEAEKVICLDKEHNDFIAENTRAAWLAYCKQNGIDPNSETTITNDNGGNDK